MDTESQATVERSITRCTSLSFEQTEMRGQPDVLLQPFETSDPLGLQSFATPVPHRLLGFD